MTAGIKGCPDLNPGHHQVGLLQQSRILGKETRTRREVGKEDYKTKTGNSAVASKHRRKGEWQQKGGDRKAKEARSKGRNMGRRWKTGG